MCSPASSGKATPDYLCAAGFSASPHFLYSGYDARGEWFQLFHIAFGGIAAAPSGDGADGHGMWPDFTNVPCEYLEAICPLRMDAHEVIPDSGGPGLHRGGNGVHTAYRILNAGDVSIHDDRWLTFPWGVRGGLPGARSRKYVERRDGTMEVLPSKCDRVRVEPGDIVHYCTWGGGGWGDPLDRPAEKVAFDVEAGLVTIDGARRYGVVIGDDLAVDEAATRTLRESMREERGTVDLFDMGGGIEEIMGRCREETGLPPPEPPVFAPWAMPASAPTDD